MLSMADLEQYTKTPPRDGLRAYIEGVRRRRGIKQEDLAEQVGLSIRAYRYWLSTPSRSAKIDWLAPAIEVLGAEMRHVQMLLASSNNGSVQQGQALVDELFSPDQRQRAEQIVNEHGDDRIVRATTAMRELNDRERLQVLIQIQSEIESRAD